MPGMHFNDFEAKNNMKKKESFDCIDNYYLAINKLFNPEKFEFIRPVIRTKNVLVADFNNKNHTWRMEIFDKDSKQYKRFFGHCFDDPRNFFAVSVSIFIGYYYELGCIVQQELNGINVLNEVGINLNMIDKFKVN